MEGENSRLQHYLARLHRQMLWDAKSQKMLCYLIRLLLLSLKFETVPILGVHIERIGDRIHFPQKWASSCRQCLTVSVSPNRGGQNFSDGGRRESALKGFHIRQLA